MPKIVWKWIQTFQQWRMEESVREEIWHFHFMNYDILVEYTGCPKKVERRFNFLAIEDKHAV